MSNPQSKRGKAGSDSGMGQVVLDDLRKTKQRDYLKELRELYLFYLDEESRTRLAGMGRLRGAIMLLVWVFQSMLLKLSPARRIALLISIVLAAFSRTTVKILNQGFDVNPGMWGFALLLLILMLELKDKLVAKDEIQIARQVQEALLPDESPHIPGWAVWSYSRPANDVGGDLVDYVDLDGFRHGVLLGDVAGKGLGAALLTAKLQATLRALVPESVSLDDLGTRVNSIFYRDGLDNRFATLFYVEVEYDSGQARFLNAGHNPAFVIRPDRVDPLVASSLPLGMLPATKYREEEIRLDPGDILLVYSDGLTEAQNEDGDEFGQERLESMFDTWRGRTPEEIGNAILDEVDAFIGDTRPHDDLSLVVVVKD
ncbi:MAG: serine/threonine-protein phosphatase [bacterium]|nr:serine/threonine-protein phosphatase [bacterium]